MRSREITRDHASMRLAGSMRMDRRREAQSTAGQREGGEWWAYHLRQHHAARSERKRSTQFVAVSTGDPLDPVWYGQLVLCFVAVYLGQKAEFCYVRWLGRVQKVAQAAGRSLDPADTRFPFNTYRWDLHPGMRGFRGHPKAGEPHYGVVTAETIMHVAPIVPAASEPLDSVDPLFVLASDMWEKF